MREARASRLQRIVDTLARTQRVCLCARMCVMRATMLTGYTHACQMGPFQAAIVLM